VGKIEKGAVMRKSCVPLVLLVLLVGLLGSAALAQGSVPAAKHAPETMTRPVRSISLIPQPLIEEGFEGGSVPPLGWYMFQNNPNATWKIMATGTPYMGSYSADCERDPAMGQQNEVLISPVVTITSGVLDFWSFGSVNWCRDTHDNCDLNIWLVYGAWDGGSYDDILVGTADTDWTGEYVWSHSVYNLTPHLKGEPMSIAFQYYGLEGAQIGLDAIQLILPDFWVFLPLVSKGP
jgi:hypothetical protein